MGNKCAAWEVVDIVKKIFPFVAVFAAAGVLGIQLVQPVSAGRQSESTSPILVGAHPDARVLSVIERSCQNCHSLKTEWPLYSRIFPVSGLVEHADRA